MMFKNLFLSCLLKNLRSSDGMKFPNEIVLYIFSFLGVAVNDVWYGKAGVELKNENDDTQLTKYEKMRLASVCKYKIYDRLRSLSAIQYCIYPFQVS